MTKAGLIFGVVSSTLLLVITGIVAAQTNPKFIPTYRRLSPAEMEAFRPEFLRRKRRLGIQVAVTSAIVGTVAVALIAAFG